MSTSRLSENSGLTINRPSAVGSPPYDPAGNQLRTPTLSSIQWDWQDQIGSISYPDPQDATAIVSEHYTYAPGGQRVRKVRETVNTEGMVTKLAITDYLGNTERRAEYAQADPAISIGYDGETVSNAVAQKDYSELRVRLGHAQSARLLTGKLSVDGPEDESKSYFDLSNHVDSVQMELDETGRLSNYQSYYPFGGTAASADGKDQTGLALKHYQYSGQEKDASGLYCYGYRYYDPSAFRWTRPDPAGLRGSGFNWYAMVSNNPVTHRDELGLMSDSVETVVVIASLVVGGMVLLYIAHCCASAVRSDRHYILTKIGKYRENKLFLNPVRYKFSEINKLYFIADEHRRKDTSYSLAKGLWDCGKIAEFYDEGAFLRQIDPEDEDFSFFHRRHDVDNPLLKKMDYHILERWSYPFHVSINRKFDKFKSIEDKNESKKYRTISNIVYAYAGYMTEEYSNIFGEKWRKFSINKKKALLESNRFMLWGLGGALSKLSENAGAPSVAAKIGFAHFLAKPGALIKKAKKNEFVGVPDDIMLDAHVHELFPDVSIEILMGENILAVMLRNSGVSAEDTRPYKVSGPFQLSDNGVVFYRIAMMDTGAMAHKYPIAQNASTYPRRRNDSIVLPVNPGKREMDDDVKQEEEHIVN